MYVLYAYIWPKTADMFLIQLSFIMKSLERLMNCEFIPRLRNKRGALFQSKRLRASQERQTYSPPGVSYSLGKIKADHIVFYEAVLTPDSPTTQNVGETDICSRLVLCTDLRHHILVWTVCFMAEYPHLP